MSQRDVGNAMKAAGYGSEDIGRLEREHPKAPQFHEGRRRALADILKMPDWWFTADDNALFPEEITDRYVQLEERVSGLADLVAGLSRRIDQQRPRPGQSGEAQPGDS